MIRFQLLTIVSLLLTVSGCSIVDLSSYSEDGSKAMRELPFTVTFDSRVAELGAIVAEREGVPQGGSPIVILQPLSQYEQTRTELLFGVNRDSEVFLTRAADLKTVKLGKVNHPVETATLFIEKGLLTISYRNTLWLYSFPDLEFLRKNERIPSYIQNVAGSPEEYDTILAGADARVYRWAWEEVNHPSERERGRFDLERYIGHGSVVSAVTYHPGGRVFFTGDWSGRVFAWKGYDEDPYAGAYDSNLFGTGFFTETASKRSLGSTLASRVDALTMKPSGEYLFVSYGTGELDMWKMRGLELALRTKLHRGSVKHFSAAGGDDLFYSYGRDQRLIVGAYDKKYDPVIDEEQFKYRNIKTEEIPGVTAMVHLSPGKLLLAKEDGSLEVYNYSLSAPE